VVTEIEGLGRERISMRILLPFGVLTASVLVLGSPIAHSITFNDGMLPRDRCGE